MGALGQQIRQFVVDNFLFGEARELADEASLLEAGIIDSTGVLELVTYLESTFNISVSDEELVPDNLDSIAKITAYISRKTGSVVSGANA